MLNRRQSKFHFKKQLFVSHKRNAELINVIIWRCSWVASGTSVVKSSVLYLLAKSFANTVSS